MESADLRDVARRLAGKVLKDEYHSMHLPHREPKPTYPTIRWEKEMNNADSRES